MNCWVREERNLECIVKIGFSEAALVSWNVYHQSDTWSTELQLFLPLEEEELQQKCLSQMSQAAFTILVYCHECVLDAKIIFDLSAFSADSQ